jgi:hypothetical protein
VVVVDSAFEATVVEVVPAVVAVAAAEMVGLGDTGAFAVA